MTAQVSRVHKVPPALVSYSYPKYISHMELNNKIQLRENTAPSKSVTSKCIGKAQL